MQRRESATVFLADDVVSNVVQGRQRSESAKASQRRKPDLRTKTAHSLVFRSLLAQFGLC